MNTEEYVYGNLIGGLGNRMFILAASYIVHKVNNIPLYIFNSDGNPHSNIDYCKTIFAAFPGKFMEIVHSKDEKYINLSNNIFNPWEPKIDMKKCRLCGYFQFYKTLKPFESELRNIFLEGLEEYTQILLKKWNFENIGFIHIRRGDYLSLQHIYPIQPLHYYKKAVEVIDKISPNTRYFILSDDNNWVKSEIYFANEKFTIFEGDELESLALMSLCKKAAICANSTFSWWGAFLGAYKYRNPVICPKNFANYAGYEDIFPEDWILI